ncbi:MAG: adenosine kinase [Micavibrio sp.]|nr:adenosine kinase [Micavibrio sp.]|tara:strand:+ start:765 stop:1748 length:984 start_codon:yes stop_codon:yes gene_type:complete
MSDDCRYGVVALGNAIVDVLAYADDSFLVSEKIAKGGMTLIDEKRAVDLYKKMETSVEASGGSAANTLAGFGSFGGKGAFVGKVAEDKLGDTFIRDMRSQGIDFDTAPLRHGPSTACCYIFVTPDAQRSMNTYLGASTEFSESDVDASIIAEGQILYMEGYLFDKDPAKKAFRKAAHFARAKSRKVALTLSDTFCVERHRQEFMDLVSKDTDIVFANTNELCALFETDDLEEAMATAQSLCDLVVVTQGPKGATILSKNERIDVPAAQVDKVVDTTGAGDQFAAGFLYGLTEGMPLAECGRLGCLAAAEVISHMGPRPEHAYKKLLG